MGAHNSGLGAARPDMVRTRNERVVLDLLRAGGAMTRQQLAKETSLTLPAIAGITAGLSASGMVREFMPPQQPGARGRPPMLVEFLASSSYVIGIRLGRVGTQIVLADALGKQVDTAPIPHFADASYDLVVAQLVARVEGLLNAHPEAKAATQAIGLCIQGTLDAETGFVREAPRMEWKDVPLADDLQAALSIPVYAIEAGRAAAVAEMVEGRAQGCSNVVVIDIGAKVSATIIIGGRMVNGAHGLAGALGSCNFPAFDGEQDEFKVDDVLSTTAAYEAFIKDHPGVQSPEGSAREAVTAAVEGDEAALKSLVRAGEVLCHAVGWVANLFNPELIILSGGIQTVPDSLRAPLIDEMLKNVAEPLRGQLQIEFSDLGIEGWERGSVLAGLQAQSTELSLLFDRQQVL